MALLITKHMGSLAGNILHECSLFQVSQNLFQQHSHISTTFQQQHSNNTATVEKVFIITAALSQQLWWSVGTSNQGF